MPKRILAIRPAGLTMRERRPFSASCVTIRTQYDIRENCLCTESAWTTCPPRIVMTCKRPRYISFRVTLSRELISLYPCRAFQLLRIPRYRKVMPLHPRRTLQLLRVPLYRKFMSLYPWRTFQFFYKPRCSF